MKTQYDYVIKKCASGFYVEAYSPSWAKDPEFTTCCFEKSGAAMNAALEEARLRDLGLTFRFIDGWPVTDPPQPTAFDLIDHAARSLGLEAVGEWTVE